jgi:hypothetical protein
MTFQLCTLADVDYRKPQAWLVLFAIMPTSLTSTYLLPAVLLNPIVILHGLNTFLYHWIPSAHALSASKHQWLENLGPTRGNSLPYFDIHDNEHLCWGYTLLMVAVQVLAYGTVNDNRVRRKSARAAAKAEREKKIALEAERKVSKQAAAMTMNGHGTGLDGTLETCNEVIGVLSNGQPLKYVDATFPDGELKINDFEVGSTSSETSSEEETIV